MFGIVGRPRLTVLGAGYLGVSHAVCLAEAGFEVLCVDIDAYQVDCLSRGVVPFFEPGLTELLKRGIESGHLTFTTSYSHAASFGNAHFICVGTPQRSDGDTADLSQLNACVSSLAPLLDSPCLVVGKSTVPVGTASAVRNDIARLAPAANVIDLAWNPEFLREGHAVGDTMRPDRIVVGVETRCAEELLRQIYGQQIANGTPFFVTDYATAELAKAAANSFLATKISFINAMAEMCEVTGGDVLTLSQILGADPRIGSSSLRPGLGFGGACLPKDIRAFRARASELGVTSALTFLSEVDSINLRCRERLIDLVIRTTGGSIKGKYIGVLGAAFKADSDDVRDSPALAVAKCIYDLGAKVTIYDPAAAVKARNLFPELEYAASMLGAATDAEALLILTDWPEFGDADPEIIGKVVAHRNVVDARHILDPDLWRGAGWDYRALGRSLTEVVR
jgi:UDPglucose 6-dehydrogenase